MKTILILLLSFIITQYSQDARMLGLGGAYSTLSSGYRAVGINPANINNGTNWTVNVFSSQSSFSNNFLNIDRYNDLNGSHFDNPLAASYYPKEEILNILNGDGLKFNSNSVFLLPGLNFSKNNYAFTSNLFFYGDIELPQAFIDMMLFGNEVGKELNMAFNQNALVSLETAFSYCKSFDDISVGGSVKYLQGIYYSNMEELGNAYFRTDTTAFVGSGNYLIRQGLGGNGFAFDVGVSTKEFDNGMKFGASLLNAFSSIEWNKDTPLRKGLENLGVTFPVREGEYFFFNFEIDSLNAELLTGGATTADIFKTDTYKASIIDFVDIPLINPLEYDEADLPPFYINVNDDPTIIESSDNMVVDPNRIVVLDDGRVIIPTENLSDSQLNLFQIEPFKVDYPTSLRFGLSKNFHNEKILVAADIVTGLDRMFGNEEKWKLGLGVEINKNPKIPLRLGLTFGGKDKYRFTLGSGYSFGSMKIDFAYGYIGGMKLSQTRGLDLAFNVYYDYKEPDEETLTFIDKIKIFFVRSFDKIKNLKLKESEK